MKHKIQIINQTCGVLSNGGLVIVPTDTLYGLAVDASNERAVKKLIDFKSRIPGKAISVFVSNIEMAKKYVRISEKNLDILKKILPGPYTVVLPSHHKLVKNLESEKGTLGIRIPDFKFINQLVKNFGKPITATSANISGRSVCYSVEALLRSLPKSKKEMIDFIVDFGKLPRNKPSTVIDLTSPELKILRQGDIIPTTEKIYTTVTPVETKIIAKLVLSNLLKLISKKPWVIILEGELGVGKTIFVKGIGEALGIKNIISPTFVIVHEYRIKNKLIDRFFHLDLYRVEEEEEFKYLGIKEMLRPKNLICIEWGEKIGKAFDLIKKSARLVYIKMEYLNEKKRKIKCEY